MKKKYEGKNLIINVGDHIDTIHAPDFENAIMDEMGKFDSLTLDFTDLVYISSSGLRVLVMTQKKLKPQNIEFTIKNINDTIMEIFTISGFDKILNIE